MSSLIKTSERKPPFGVHVIALYEDGDSAIAHLCEPFNDHPGCWWGFCAGASFDGELPEPEYWMEIPKINKEGEDGNE